MILSAFDWIQLSAALAMTGASAWTDLRNGLIPNRITGPGIFIGLAAGLANGGPQGLLVSIAGALATSLVPLALFRFQAMGGGDVKLFAALGALLGAGPALEAQAVAFVISAFQGIWVWLRAGRLKQGLIASVKLLIRPSLLMEPGGAQTAVATEIRLGPAIFAATLFSMLVRVSG